MELSVTQKTTFQDRGILKISGLLSSREVQIVREDIFAELERLKFKVKGKFSTGKMSGVPVFQQTSHLSQMIRPGANVAALFNANILQIANVLGGSKLKPTQALPQLLLSLPHRENWSLENLNWHLDLKVPAEDHIPGVQVFILIDDLRPQGGGTLAIAGSHRLHYLPTAKGNAHEIIRQDFYHDKLKSGRSFSVEGVEVSIQEMHGKAGDVYFMDLRVLHSPSINASKNMRIMTTNRFIK